MLVKRKIFPRIFWIDAEKWICSLIFFERIEGSRISQWPPYIQQQIGNTRGRNGLNFKPFKKIEIQLFWRIIRRQKILRWVHAKWPYFKALHIYQLSNYKTVTTPITSIQNAPKLQSKSNTSFDCNIRYTTAVWHCLFWKQLAFSFPGERFDVIFLKTYIVKLSYCRVLKDCWI